MIDKFFASGNMQLITSVKSTVSQGNIKYYAIKIRSCDFELYDILENLWPFGTIEISQKAVEAIYIVKPEEIEDFRINLLKLDCLNRMTLKEVVVS